MNNKTLKAHFYGSEPETLENLYNTFTKNKQKSVYKFSKLEDLDAFIFDFFSEEERDTAIRNGIRDLEIFIPISEFMRLKGNLSQWRDSVMTKLSENLGMSIDINLLYDSEKSMNTDEHIELIDEVSTINSEIMDDYDDEMMDEFFFKIKIYHEYSEILHKMAMSHVNMYDISDETNTNNDRVTSQKFDEVFILLLDKIEESIKQL